MFIWVFEDAKQDGTKRISKFYRCGRFAFRALYNCEHFQTLTGAEINQNHSKFMAFYVFSVNKIKKS